MNVEFLKSMVCQEFQVSDSELTTGKRGGRNVTHAKMAFALLSRQYLKSTVVSTSTHLNINHSSVINLLVNAEDYVTTYESLKVDVSHGANFGKRIKKIQQGLEKANSP